MLRMLLVPVIIFAVLAGWVLVQQAYARFARRHPQLGPFRREGGGCTCRSGHCDQSAQCSTRAHPAR